MEKQHRPKMAVSKYSLLAALLVALALIGNYTLAEYAGSHKARGREGTDSSGPLVVVDAGHGGMDGGALGAGGVKESPLNLAVAKLVETGLRARGIRVIMTREDEHALGRSKNADMQMRRKIMRGEDVSAIISIHMNIYRNSSACGPRTFYMKGSAPGKLLASQVLQAVCESVGYPKRLATAGNYFVLRESVAPAAIVECGFLSNASDTKRLQDPDYQQKLADGIVNGVMAYLTTQLVIDS